MVRATIGARAAGVALTVLSGALAAACGAGNHADGAEGEPAARRCEPVRSTTSGLSEVFPELARLGPVVSAGWCGQALGSLDTGRVLVPGPSDWVYYGVVRLADSAAAEGSGPWKPAGGPPTGIPIALSSFIPAHGQWSSNGAGVYLDRSSATLVLGSVPLGN